MSGARRPVPATTRLASDAIDRLRRVTPAEARVLLLLAEGVPAADISRALERSMSTVSLTCSALRRKLGLPAAVALEDFAVAALPGWDPAVGPPDASGPRSGRLAAD